MKKNLLGILAVSSVIFLTSCLDNNNTTQPQTGAFLLAQTSPDAPNVGVYINGSPFDTLHFGNYTRYIGGITPGSYSFAVDSFGISNSSNARLKSNVTIDANKYYSYFIIDSFSKVKAAWINDVFQAPSSDSIYVRFFNFCPNTAEPINLVNSDNTAWSQSRTFNDQSNPQFVAFNERLAGTYTLSLKTVSGTVLKTQNNIVLTGGHVYTLFAKGTIGSSSADSLSIGVIQNYPFQ
jgi:hypothetical protein